MKDNFAAVMDIRAMYYRVAQAYLDEVNERAAKKYLDFAAECYEFAQELLAR